MADEGRCPSITRYPDARCDLDEGHPGAHEHREAGATRQWVALDQGLANLRAAMERDEPGSSATGRCMNCGDVFFLADEKARVGATYGFCDGDCEDSYVASVVNPG